MWPAILGAAGSLIGSGISAWQADKASRRQFGQQKELMQLQDSLNRNQYEWQYNKFLSPFALREQYEAAGFNVNDIARQGGSMIQSGNLGSVSGGSTSAVLPDTSGITNAGNILAQGAKTASETKLNIQKAVTEQKMQYLHDTAADLNIAVKDNKIAQTALTDIHRWISERVKENKVKLSNSEVDAASKNLLILDEQLKDWQFKTKYLNPAQYANAQADYVSTVFATLLTMTNIRLGQAEFQFIMEKIKTEMVDRQLKKAQEQQALASAFHSYMQGSESYWRAGIEKQKFDNNYGVYLADDIKYSSQIKKEQNDFHYGQHLAEGAKWGTKVKKRYYRWYPVMSTANVVHLASKTGVNIFSMAESFLNIRTGGLYKHGQKPISSKEFEQEMDGAEDRLIRSLFESNGEREFGMDEVTY